jgi:transposase
MLLYLPPYSPDLNPIEMAFAKLKAFLRAAQSQTYGKHSRTSSIFSCPVDAKTISPLRDTTHPDRKML